MDTETRKKIEGIVETVGNLSHKELEVFFVLLSNKIQSDSFTARKAGKSELADSLGSASSQLLNAGTLINGYSKC